MDGTDRLIGDDQLDHRQGVEHSDSGDVPAEGKEKRTTRTTDRTTAIVTEWEAVSRATPPLKRPRSEVDDTGKI